jgi:8-oxo-dGTP pyrophosphatase MutT (NUDIX family)
MCAGETAEATAVRECLEETGLAVQPAGRLSTVTQQYAHGLIEITFVACQAVGVLAASEAPFRWVAAADLGTYSFPSANAELIRQLVAAAKAR